MDNQFYCYVSVDGDSIGSAVGRASLADDVAEIRRLSNAIEAGNAIWKSWALASGGESIGCGGDECRLRVPASKLGDIPGLRAEYESAVGATCTVGVGRRIKEADKALLAGKLLGKDRVVTYSPEAEKLVAEASQPKDEKEKIAEEYLNKAEPNHLNDFKQLADDDSRKQLALRHEEGQVKTDEELTGLKAQVAGIIVDFQKQLPQLEQAKTENPELYQSLTSTMQALLVMANQLFGKPEQLGKTEKYVGTHKAPYNTGDNAPLHQLDVVYPPDIYTHPQAHHFYGHGGGDVKIDKETIGLLKESRGMPEKSIKVYRAVPHDVPADSKINPGDWVTPNVNYAKIHGEGPLHGKYRILEHTVPAKHLFTDGNSIHEFGYDPSMTKAEPKMSEEEFKNLVSKNKELRQQRAGRIQHLAENTKGSSWAKKQGGFAVVGLDPHNRNQWRVTHVADGGEGPLNHTVHETHEDALEAAHHAGANILGNPLKTLSKSEETCLVEDLQKGAMSRLFPYSPQTDQTKGKRPFSQSAGREKLHDWQMHGDAKDREKVPQMKGNVMARALHGLHGKTQVRTNQTGEREFLLHRAVGQEEHATHISGENYSSQQNKSWAPLDNHGQQANHGIGKKLVSAWIPESSILSVPKQYGTLKPRDDKGQLWDRMSGKAYAGGSNEFAPEHEVITKPGSFSLHKSEDQLHGGTADDMEDVEFDPEQLAIGIKHELEHTQDADIAEEIAKDHLATDEDYYKKLATIEKTVFTGKHKLVLPVGTQLSSGPEGGKQKMKVKIKDAQTGKIKWRQVGSGMVMDSEGNPVSSRAQS